MKKTSPSNPYFILSFIPALAYWILETYTTLEMALLGGVFLGFAEMILEKKFSGHVHTLSKVNLSLIVVLGLVSLVAKEGVWFKLQPTFTGVGIFCFLMFKKIKGQSLMFEMVKDMGQTSPLGESVFKTIELHMMIFLIVFAGFMAKVAIYNSTSNWLFWKTGGFYIAFGGFMILEMIYIRFYLKGKQK